MAGVACVEQILKHRHDFEIAIFGEETHANYNRILLSMVHAGEKSPDDIVLNDVDWYRANGIRACLGVRIAKIDRTAGLVLREDGEAAEYDRLILVRKETVYAPEPEHRKMLDRLPRSKALCKDAWLERE